MNLQQMTLKKSTQQTTKKPLFVHIDSEALLDPSYDHDHSIAHGQSDLSRLRTKSFSSHALVPALLTPSVATINEVSLVEDSEKHRARRRLSHDFSADTRKYYINVQEVQQKLLKQEDTDGDFQISVTDTGPKMIPVGTYSSYGHNKIEIRGHYALANLLQELAIATDHGRSHIVLDKDRLSENPVDRLSRLIKHHFWDGLTRKMDGDGLEAICTDPKNRNKDVTSRIYVPFSDSYGWDYYNQVAMEKPGLKLEVIRLPEHITPEYVYSIYPKFGILSLGLRHVEDNGIRTKAIPFVVPGGRFNEMYGWDSYFESLGLIEDGRVDLAKAMVDNFVYEINHYGKILNANRSYYLTRSQPPFLTDMVLKTYEMLATTIMKDEPKKRIYWLRRGIQAAIKEYYEVWMRKPRYVEEYGLSRFHPEGYGMPPETESSHFDAILTPYAEKMGISVKEYSLLYSQRKIDEPELDEYFIHDRAVRESGHDTTYRLEGKCANILPVDLNCLLYKYEIDIGNTIKHFFDDKFYTADAKLESSAVWFERAERRKEKIEKYLWNEKEGIYFDYDIKEKAQTDYESVTNFFVLWAGVASKERAALLVTNCLKLFEVKGGLVSGTERSKGVTSLSRPNRQWDYPYGWAPHQILAWKGLADYGYIDISRRLAYRWLFMITKAFVDYNGVVPEKFDAVTLNHRVKVEYGNVGTDFKMIPREGFGWMNSSFKVGLTYLTDYMRRALGTLANPDSLLKKIREKEKKLGHVLPTDYSSSPSS